MKTLLIIVSLTCFALMMNVGDPIVTMAPGREGPTIHDHEDEDDAFYVLEGEIVFILGDEELIAAPGTFVLVPPGVMHTFANRTTKPARILNIHAPAGFDRRLLGE